MKVQVKLTAYHKTELQNQMDVIRRSEIVRAKYHQLKLLFHVPNGGTRGTAEAKHRRESGVKPGAPDLYLPAARGGYHSLWIEMKTETGKISQNQDWWGEELRAEGNFVEVCHAGESAVRALEWYMGLGKESAKRRGLISQPSRSQKF